MKAPLLHLSVPEDSSFRFWHRLEPRFDLHRHFHPEHQIEFLVRGRGRQFAGDRVADVSAGELVLIGAYLPHTLMIEPGPRGNRMPESFMIQFQESCLGTEFFDCPELRAVRDLLQRCRGGLLFSREQCRPVARLLRQMSRQTAFERLQSLLSILQQLAAIDNPRHLASETYQPLIVRRDYERINLVCRFIAEHLAEPFTESDVAALVYLGPSAFSRFFRRVTGSTFVDYVCAQRIAKACKLLIETETPVLDICFDVGFGNRTNFNRHFKRRRGMSPLRFRKLYRESAATGAWSEGAGVTTRAPARLPRRSTA